MRAVRPLFESAMLLTWGAKSLGFFAPYGSYWVALSMIQDGEEVRHIEKYIKHVEEWTKVHTILKPRCLHLRAELASRTDTVEVR